MLTEGGITDFSGLNFVGADAETDSTGRWLVVTYWGSTPEGHSFDILVNDRFVATENLPDDKGMRYYERDYRLPVAAGSAGISAGMPLRITFRARPGQTAGPVFGLRVTSNPREFPHYLFY